MTNPFKYYHPNDFNFSNDKNFKLNITKGVGIENADENKIILEANSPKFVFTLTGFGKSSLEDVVLRHKVI